MIQVLHVLAQAVPPAAPAPPGAGQWVTLDKLFWYTLLFIFLATIVSTLIRLRLKDKCLKLMHDFHVTYVTTTGRVAWGDLLVFSLGLELRFDAPLRTRRGLVKSSSLIYQPELVQCQALCRVEDSLTEEEKKERRRQIAATFNPNLFRRCIRWMYNIFNTIRDAFSRALSAFIGQITRTSAAKDVLAPNQASMDQIGQNVLTALGNAYEPMLERHIGKPVVLELASPADPAKQIMEIPGYLVDYTDKYLAVFNVDHLPVERLELEVSEAAERPGLKIAMTERDVTVTCTGPEAVVVQRVQSGEKISDLSAVLTIGSAVTLPRFGAGPVKLWAMRTQRFDIVCPRTQANVRFGSDEHQVKRKGWFGLSPEWEDGKITDWIRNIRPPSF